MLLDPLIETLAATSSTVLARIWEVIWEGRKVSLRESESLENYLLYAVRHLIGSDRPLGTKKQNELILNYSYKDVKKITSGYETNNQHELYIEIELLNGKTGKITTKFISPNTCHQEEEFKYHYQFNCFNPTHEQFFSELRTKIAKSGKNFSLIHLIGLEKLHSQQTIYPNLSTLNREVAELLTSDAFRQILNEIHFETSTIVVASSSLHRFREDWQNLHYFASRPLKLGYSFRNFSPSLAKTLLLRMWDPEDYQNKVVKTFQDEVKLMLDQGCQSRTIAHAIKTGHFFLLLRICLVTESRSDNSISVEELYNGLTQEIDQQAQSKAKEKFDQDFKEYNQRFEKEIEYLKQICNSSENDREKQHSEEFINRAVEQGLYRFVIKNFLLKESPIFADITVDRFGGYIPFVSLRKNYGEYFENKGIDFSPGKIESAIQIAQYRKEIDRLQNRGVKIPVNLELKEGQTPSKEQIGEVFDLMQQRIAADREAHQKNLEGLKKYEISIEQKIQQLNREIPDKIIPPPLTPRNAVIETEIAGGNYLDFMKAFYAGILKQYENENFEKMIADGSFGSWLALNFPPEHDEVISDLTDANANAGEKNIERVKNDARASEERIAADKEAHQMNLEGLRRYKSSIEEKVQKLNLKLPKQGITLPLLIPRDDGYSALHGAIKAGNYLNFMKTFYANILKDHKVDNIDEMIADGSFGDWLADTLKPHAKIKSAKRFDRPGE